jgi:Cu(I)/Ag(I) efflux system membrane fusion protein
MNKLIALGGIAGILAIGLGSGYWLGARSPHLTTPPTAVATGTAQSERRVLYYRNPMGLPDTSPVPKKDPMGMDYVPVFEGDAPETTASGIRISVDKVQKIGVRTEPAAVRVLSRTIRAVGVLQADERRLYSVSPRLEGWIERLHVNSTGQVVGRGQPLMEIYSPDLVATQEEYLIAWRGTQSLHDAAPEIRRSMELLADSALQRLRNWEISEAEIQQLRREGRPRQTMVLRSPMSGVVLEKAAFQGMRFMSGEMLYRIADLSTVWLIADVYEQDLTQLRLGAPVKVRITAYPGREFSGKVSFVYPTVAQDTRTARARVELPNPDGLLKPEMYAEARIEATADGQEGRLSVPDSAVIDSGTRRIVLVQRDEGRFEPREVRLGHRGSGYVEVLEGVAKGENVVTGANFLIDAESNLKAALSSFGGHSGHGSAGEATAPKTSGPTDTTASRSEALRTRGKVISVEVANASVVIEHDAVPALKWPAMTMPFAVPDRTLLRSLRPGQSIEFGFTERGAGDYALTDVKPGAAADAHKGH